MKKFRIVETGEGFFIQYKSFFCWHNYHFTNVSYHRIYDKFREKDTVFSIAHCYPTLNSAMKDLEAIKSSLIPYKGHKIDVARCDDFDGKIVYLDIDSRKGEDYLLGSEDLEDLKKQIDEAENDEIERKFRAKKEKENKKIINVYKV